MEDFHHSTLQGYSSNSKIKSSLVAQQVKDPALSLHQLGSLLWHRFNLGPGTSICPGAAKNKNKGWKKKTKPYLNNCNYNISISHTGHFAAIIISQSHSTGIDIERITERVERVKHKFLSENELSNINSKSERTHLALLWAAKEAAYKILNIPQLSFYDIETDKFQPYLNGDFNAKIKNNDILNLQYKVYRDFVLVWTIKWKHKTITPFLEIGQTIKKCLFYWLILKNIQKHH